VSWRWSDVLLGLAPFLLFRVATVVMDPRSPLAAALHRLWMPLTLLAQAWLIVVPLGIARSRSRGVPLTHLPRPRAVVVEALFALLALPAVYAAAIAVFLLAAARFGDTSSPSGPWIPLMGSFNRIEWLAFIALAIMLAPVAEEILYRGVFYNLLRQRLHPIVAASLQAIVFGVLHPFGLANSAAITMVGLALALVYEWRKTLLAPILLHAAVNGVGMAILTWSLAADAAAPRLGVFGEPHQGGCLVTGVVPGSAAETAGLQVGDVITAVDGESVADILGLAQVIRKHRVGDTVSIAFTRRGKAQRVDVDLQRLKESPKTSE
jgi:membrane protease YdiL (CAAX protease family)